MPAVFHIGQLSHTRLLVQHFIIVDHHVFHETEGGIAGINHFEDAAPGQILHRLQKEDADAEQQPQHLHFAPRLTRFRFTTHGNHAQRKNKDRQQVVVPGKDGQNFGGLFDIGGMQRQQSIEVGGAVRLAKRVIEGGKQRVASYHNLLHPRGMTPQQM